MKGFPGSGRRMVGRDGAGLTAGVRGRGGSADRIMVIGTETKRIKMQEAIPSFLISVAPLSGGQMVVDEPRSSDAIYSDHSCTTIGNMTLLGQSAQGHRMIVDASLLAGAICSILSYITSCKLAWRDRQMQGAQPEQPTIGDLPSSWLGVGPFQVLECLWMGRYRLL